MSFSGALLLADLDDFITPSQSCVKPVKLDQSEGKEVQRLDIDNESGTYVQINKDGSSQKLEKTEISLADCLACSGCVTSAESILVNQQSVDTFGKRLESIDRHNESNPMEKIMIVFSISPQSRASIASRYEINDPMEAMRRMVHFCKTNLNASYVFDTTWSRHFALWEMCQEFVDKYRRHNDQTPTLPLLTSACPGWVCYAEKTQQASLPFISAVKSPQQIMGTMVKDFFARKIRDLGTDNKDERYTSFYHISVMPCYDKKLEGSREDFQAELFETEQEVDLVLTTTEWEELMHKKNFGSLKDIPMVDKIDPLFNEVHDDPLTGKQILGNMAGMSGSGGYLETVFRYAASTLFGVHNVGTIQYKVGRNEDFRECWLEIEGKKVLHFALAYGFRNIQNIVRKLNSKRKRLPYHFVEVMACPSGCLNGGGQIPAPSATRRREFLQQVQNVYHNVPIQHEKPPMDMDSTESDDDNIPTPGDLLRGWLADDRARHKALKTQYHARDSLNINPLAIKW